MANLKQGGQFGRFFYPFAQTRIPQKLASLSGTWAEPLWTNHLFYVWNIYFSVSFSQICINKNTQGIPKIRGNFSNVPIFHGEKLRTPREDKFFSMISGQMNGIFAELR